jgi:hypothetical protein
MRYINSLVIIGSMSLFSCKNQSSSSAESVKATINGNTYLMSLTLETDKDSGCVFLQDISDGQNLTEANVLSSAPKVAIVNKQSLATEEIEKILREAGGEANLVSLIAPDEKDVSAKFFVKVKDALEASNNTSGTSCAGLKPKSFNEDLEDLELSLAGNELNLDLNKSKYNNKPALYKNKSKPGYVMKNCSRSNCYYYNITDEKYNLVKKMAESNPIEKCRLYGYGSITSCTRYVREGKFPPKSSNTLSSKPTPWKSQSGPLREL